MTLLQDINTESKHMEIFIKEEVFENEELLGSDLSCSKVIYVNAPRTELKLLHAQLIINTPVDNIDYPVININSDIEVAHEPDAAPTSIIKLVK